MTETAKVRLGPYITRFAWVFIAFSLAAAALIAALDMQNNIGLAVGIVGASAVSAGQYFLREQQRPFGLLETVLMSFYSLVVMALAATAFLGGWWLLIQQKWLPAGGLPEQILDWNSGRWSIAAIFAVICLLILLLAYGFITRLMAGGLSKRGQN